jgi:hypothetical protein
MASADFESQSGVDAVNLLNGSAFFDEVSLLIP